MRDKPDMQQIILIELISTIMEGTTGVMDGRASAK